MKVRLTRGLSLKFICLIAMLKYKHVILIDDDPITNFINTKLITMCFDFAVTSFTSAAEALVDLERRNGSGRQALPDLIFLDINMPQMDGWEFLDELERVPDMRSEKLHIVMLSSSVDSDDRERAGMYRCVYDFISKPLTKDKINSLVRGLEQLVD